MFTDEVVSSMAGVVASSEASLASTLVLETSAGASLESTTSGMATFFDYLAANPPVAVAVSIILFLWVYVWKGVALWRAAKRGHIVWFVALLITNFMGILDIVYYLYLSNVDWSKWHAKLKAFFSPEEQKKSA